MTGNLVAHLVHERDRIYLLGEAGRGLRGQADSVGIWSQQVELGARQGWGGLLGEASRSMIDSEPEQGGRTDATCQGAHPPALCVAEAHIARP